MKRERVKSIEIKNISELLSDGRCLFQQISYSFPIGKNIFIESPPGSGTSELLKIIAGLKQPTFGDIFYNGQSVKKMTFTEFNPIRRSTSYCFDNGGLISDMTIKENIEFPLKFLNSWRKQRSPILLNELVYYFGIGDYLDLYPEYTSQSVRKIAGLIRSFLWQPQILFLDEPTLGIGAEGAQALLFWIEKLNREGKKDQLIVMASSDRSFARLIECVHLKLKEGVLTTIEAAA